MKPSDPEFPTHLVSAGWDLAFRGPLVQVVLPRIVLVDRRGPSAADLWPLDCPLVGPTCTRGPGELLLGWWSVLPCVKPCPVLSAIHREADWMTG